MIQGYPEQTSLFPGDRLGLYVSTDAPQFRVDFYRQGATLDFQLSSDWMTGKFADVHDPDQDWGVAAVRRDGKAVDAWTAYPFDIPDNWTSGVYIAMLVEGDGDGNPNPNQNPPLERSTADARSGKALFIVKNPNPGINSQMLYKIPLFTYQMYNMTVYQGIDGKIHAGAGYPFDDPANPGYDTLQFWVTFRRPGAGTGGTPWDAVYFGTEGNQDPLDRASYRQMFVHWDAKMIAWLESSGYRVDYCTDLDVHLDSNLTLLTSYSIVLSIGHDEYYSVQMRNNLETYVANGGNIAFFSGNTSFWRLLFPVLTAGQPDLRFITRDYNWAQYPASDAPSAPGRPEDSLTGVGFRNGGERNDPLPNGINVGYTVQNTHLWPFEKTGLGEDDTFGKNDCIIGYECDGTPYARNKPRPVLPTFNSTDTTPPDLIILGTADTSVWLGQPGAAIDTTHNMSATMAMYAKNGVGFTGATTDWPRVLLLGDSSTQAITRNVINRLGGLPKGYTGIANLQQVVACDGFYSPDDQSRHAIVATVDGSIWEVYYNPDRGISQTKVDTIPGVIDVASFYSADDKYRHVLAAGGDGTLWEVYFNPAWGISQVSLGSFSNMSRVAGFYTSDDKNRHAIVATSDGDVFELFYNPTTGKGQVLLGSFDQIVDVGAFYSPDDGNRHAIVAEADGNITEIFYNPKTGLGQVSIGNFPGVARICAFYADGDAFFSRRVIVATADGRIQQIKYSAAAGIVRTVLMSQPKVLDVGAFFTPDDGDRHVIVATNDGEIRELFYVRAD